MNYKEFLTEIKALVQDRMGTDYDVSIRKETKNNGVMLDGLIINKKSEKLAPVIYLNSYYEQLDSSMTLSEIVAELVSIYKENMGGYLQTIEDLTVFDNFRDRVVYKLIQAESNRKLLTEIPNICFLDMAIVFYLLLDRNEAGHMTALIHNNHLDYWNTTKGELFRLAKINTPKLLPAKIKTMKEVTHELLADQFEQLPGADFFDEILEDVPGKSPLYVLTNQDGINGAGCILYEGCLGKFAKEEKSDIIILPSSIHETLLTLDCGDLDYEEMDEMVKQINKNEVPIEDVLSNRIYRYSLSSGKISIVNKV